MKKKLILIMLLFSIKLTYGQDTLYYDSYQKATIKTNAVYKKIITLVNNHFLVERYDPQHTLLSKENYIDKTLKLLSGPAIYYNDNGTKDSEGIYSNNKRDSTWRFYTQDNHIAGIVEFKNGELEKEEYFQADGQPLKDVKKANQVPSFKGGLEALSNYIASSAHYPEKSLAHGKVVVAFVIAKDGSVTNVHVSSSVNDELDREALRVISKMPDWIPGIQFNRPVKVRYQVPIAF